MRSIGRTSVALAGVVTALAVIAVTAAQSPADVAVSARGSTTISCANTAWTYAIPRKRPSRCVVFRHNRGDHADDVDLRKIHWRHWGASKATAKATSVYLGMGHSVRTPARLTASRLRQKCGHRAYTRLRVYRNGTVTRLRPPACRRRLR
jgi:hypothetical protein